MSQELRYHGYFLGSCSFTLIYEFLHNPNVAPVHLPWVYASLQLMSIMRPGDPIASTISAIQTVLRKINPSYEWLPYAPSGAENIPHPEPAATQQVFSADRGNRSLLNSPGFPQSSSLGMRPDLASSWNIPQLENMDKSEFGGSVGSGEDLLDFTQSDMGWDFDFSTMDLESFFSIYSNNVPVL